MTSRILVTGGASGLGLALTRLWTARGEQVLVTDLAPERPAVLPPAAQYLRLDVRSDDDWAAARAWVETHWGGLDILVNNAGIPSGGRIDVETMQEWERVLDINLLGVVRGCRTFTPMLRAQGSGHIVNTASLAGLVHGAGMSSYNAAKAAVVALTETLGFELHGDGIRTSVVCPGFFRTNLHENFGGADTALNDQGAQLVTRARLGADRVAAAVVRGVDRGEEIILPESQSRLAHPLKRFARPVYRWYFRRLARGVQRPPRPSGP